MTLREVTQQYVINLNKAGAITGLGEQIISISIKTLEGIINASQENTTKQKLNNHKELLKNLYKSPILGELVPTISGQQVVLVVSAFEVYMSDLVRCIGNEYRSLLKWPEGSSGKVDLSILNSDITTIGDLILGIVEQQSISFQDLQSTKRFLKEYLGINFSMTKDEEDDLILAAATRHAIVHGGSIADSKFIKQIRNTKYANKYSPGQKIEVEPNQAKKFRIVFYKAGRMIFKELNAKLKIPKNETKIAEIA
jgi:hypothetical protein